MLLAKIYQKVQEVTVDSAKHIFCSHQLMTSTRSNHTQVCQHICGFRGLVLLSSSFIVSVSVFSKQSYAFKTRTKQPDGLLLERKIAQSFFVKMILFVDTSVYLTASPADAGLSTKSKQISVTLYQLIKRSDRTEGSMTAGSVVEMAGGLLLVLPETIVVLKK